MRPTSWTIPAGLKRSVRISPGFRLLSQKSQSWLDRKQLSESEPKATDELSARSFTMHGTLNEVFASLVWKQILRAKRGCIFPIKCEFS